MRGDEESGGAEEWRPADGPVVGQAWGTDRSDSVAGVTVAVGVDDPVRTSDRDRIDDLEAENATLAADNEALAADNEALRERTAAVEDRLAAVESALGTDGTPAPVDD